MIGVSQIRHRTIVFVFLLLFPAAYTFGQSISSGGDEETIISPYRALALEARNFYAQNDCPAAARSAKTLETNWDLNSYIVKAKSKENWNEIDDAMDAFIQPLKTCAVNAPDKKVVDESYNAFLSKLSRADGPWYGYISDPSQMPTAERGTSGITYLITQRGTGRQPKVGEIVVARVGGVLEDGSDFRHSKTLGEPEAILLRAGSKIPGLLDGLSHLRVGDHAILVVPPALAYGEKGRSSEGIPENATLTYFVEVVDVKSKGVAEMLFFTIDSKGIDAAVDQYRELQSRGFPDLYFSEGDLNSLGSTLLHDGNAMGAVKIFQLNVDAFPRSANVYDSLGEAYLADGQKNLAIENYKKALSIDPKMQSSIQALARLNTQ